MPKKRDNQDWEMIFKLSVPLLKVSEQFDDKEFYIEKLSKLLRNPIVFDNQVKESTNILPYRIPNLNNDEETLDHLVGMSNIVLYIIKNKLYDKWQNIDDFKNTLFTLQVLIYCPKNLNNKSKFKKNWLFKYNDVEISVQWNEKLKKYGITDLEDINTGQLVSVDTVYSIWFNQNKKYL